MEANLNQKTEYSRITGILLVVPILFILLPIYFFAQIKRDILSGLINFNLLIEIMPAMTLVVLFEILSMLTLIILFVLSIFFYIRRNRKFPKCIIALLGYYSIFLLVDYTWYNAIAEYATPQIAENFNAPYRKVIYRSLIISVLFIPYFIFSKRVKGTFTR